MPPVRGSSPARLSALGISDAESASLGAYVSAEYAGDTPFVASTAGGGIAGTGIVTLPSGWTYAMLANHPGLLHVGATALNDVGLVDAGATSAQYSGFCSANTKHSFSHIFSSPTALSTATERYWFMVGSALFSGAGPSGGFFLEYRDDANGGYWACCEAIANSKTVLLTTSVVPTAKAWNKLVINQDGANVKWTLNGVVLGTVTSALINSGSIVPFAIGGIYIKKLVSAGAQVAAFLDYSSFFAQQGTSGTAAVTLR